jgi:hypothetical protein
MALYIFGIGGTGARIIKALTLLMASGVQVANTNAIIPVLIDPDNSNGDLARTLELLRLYRSLRQHTEQNVNKFFFNEIKSLADGAANNTASEYHFAINGIGNDRFKDTIELSSMSRSSQAMTQMLFSDHNLNADMQLGFKGNPNIGSVVLNRFKDSETFRAFATSFNQDDRIVIIGSIFGGTGAAGLPLLIKNLRDADPSIPKHELLRNAPIAAISVLPYFDVQESEQVSIDSNTFVSKTKAALNYYAANLCKNNSLNALYYIGDTVANTHKGADGAADQRNKAHFIELAAAMAIVDFMSCNKSDLVVERGKALAPKYFEYGLKEETNKIEFRHLGPQTFDTAGKSLTQYFLFQKFLRDFYADMPENTAWMKNGNNKLTPESFNPRMLNDLHRFNDAFDEWLAEMEQSSTGFKPFNREVKEKDILNAVIGFREQTSAWNIIEPKGTERFSKILSKHEDKLSATSSERKLFSLFYLATKEIIKERIKL